MRELIDRAVQHIKGYSLLDMSLLKLCLLSLGAIIGISIPKKRSKLVGVICGIVFVSTYAVLMVDFISSFIDRFRGRCVDVDIEL